MKLEELQAIWDTQNDRPVFSLNDSRLSVGLYQQRAYHRKRMFRVWFAPMMLTMLVLLGANLITFLGFFMKTITRMRITDPQMTWWDGAFLASGVASALAILVPYFKQWRAHEKAQEIFAPSLREELERGITQLDFEMRLNVSTQARVALGLIAVAMFSLLFEMARWNGLPPSKLLRAGAVSLVVGVLAGFAAEKKVVARIAERKRALQSMLASLDESAESK
jgi:hypothetical protein